MLIPRTNTGFWRVLVKDLALFSVGASVALSAQDFHSDFSSDRAERQNQISGAYCVYGFSLFLGLLPLCSL
jgi:hypothetical protein